MFFYTQGSFRITKLLRYLNVVTDYTMSSNDMEALVILPELGGLRIMNDKRFFAIPLNGEGLLMKTEYVCS